MFTPLILAALAVVAVVTSFISGIFGMAGGMLLIGFLLMMLPVPVAMVFHGVIQIAANGWRVVAVAASHQLARGAGVRRRARSFSLVVFSFFAFVPAKALVLIGDRADAVRRAGGAAAHRAQHRTRRAGLPGRRRSAAPCSSCPASPGPILDIFYVRTGMTRQINVATKAAAQVMGHLTKVTYFGRRGRQGPAGRDLEQWLVMAYRRRASRCWARPCRAVSSTGCRTSSSIIGRAA